MLLLIQGIFYQKIPKTEIGSAHGSQGSVPFFTHVIAEDLFSGIIPLDDLGIARDGGMSDLLGISNLSRVEYCPEEGTLKFQKDYRERNPGSIHYSFQRSEDGAFVGRWRASFGNGPARCVLTVVDDSFVQIPEEFQLPLN